MTTLMTNALYALVRKGFTVHHAATAKEAADIALNLIPESASVGFGGSVTVRDMNLYETLQAAGHPVHWHWKNDEPKPAVFANAATADVYLTSTNAITADGCLVNIDGTGNRVGAMIAGPKQVIIIAGSNTPAKKDKNTSTVQSSPQSELRKAIEKIITAVGLVVYFALSFLTQAWYITWVVFPIMAATQGLVNACMDLKEAKSHES
jgi:hypothetical protein